MPARFKVSHLLAGFPNSWPQRRQMNPFVILNRTCLDPQLGHLGASFFSGMGETPRLSLGGSILCCVCGLFNLIGHRIQKHGSDLEVNELSPEGVDDDLRSRHTRLYHTPTHTFKRVSAK
jgi:hypothetical protein